MCLIACTVTETAVATVAGQIKQLIMKQNFFSSVYTVESDNDFDTLPSRMDVQVDGTTFTVTEDDISKKLIQLKIDVIGSRFNLPKGAV